MRSNLLQNLKRDKVLLILQWCKDHFGRSKFHSYPRLRLCHWKSIDEDKDTVLGTYNKGLIIIYTLSHRGLKHLCSTVLHEYRHYLLSPREYNSFSKELQNKGYDSSVIYEKHPHEKECRKFAEKWVNKCFQELKKDLYKNE